MGEAGGTERKRFPWWGRRPRKPVAIEGEGDPWGQDPHSCPFPPEPPPLHWAMSPMSLRLMAGVGLRLQLPAHRRLPLRPNESLMSLVLSHMGDSAAVALLGG